MKTIKALLIIFGLGLLLTSCQKDNDPPTQNSNNKLFGTWNFVGMNATIKHTLIAGTGADQEKLITSYPIVATNPKGTITIDPTTFKSNNITYSYKTTIKTQFYLGGVLDDSDEMPFEGDAPASSATTTYSTFATDSVHLNSGLISFEAAGATRQTMPQDFKISWENDVLVLTSPIAYSGIQPVNGGTAQVLIQGTQVIRLKK